MLLQYAEYVGKPGVNRFLEKLRTVQTNNTLYQSWYTAQDQENKSKKRVIIGVFKDRPLLFDQFCLMLSVL